MKDLFKLFVLSSPILALVFYFAMSRQEKIDADFEKESLQFDKEWNSWNAEFSHDKESQQKYRTAADKSEKSLSEIEERRRKAQQRQDKLVEDIDKQMNELSADGKSLITNPNIQSKK